MKGGSSNCAAAQYAKQLSELAEKKKTIEMMQIELEGKMKKQEEKEEANRLQSEKDVLLNKQKMELTKSNMSKAGIY